MSYRGLYTAKVDDKGRVSFPAKFRDVLAKSGRDDLFITNFKSDGIHCLEVYPHAKWLAVEETLRQQKDSPRIIKYIQNVYLPGVQECQVDRQGRVLLPNRLREYAGLDHEVVFVGLVDHLRIWSAANWESVSATTPDLSDDPDFISLLGAT